MDRLTRLLLASLLILVWIFITAIVINAIQRFT